MMKKGKLIAGLCLVAQSLLFFVLFLVYWNRSKSLSRTLAVFAAVGGVSGALLIINEMKNKAYEDEFDEDFEDWDGDFGDELEDSFDGEVSCSFEPQAAE